MQTPDKPVAEQGWTKAFAARTPRSFAENFAPDIVLEASVMAKPAAGIEQVKAIMAAASSVYEALEFTVQASEGPRTYLEWEARAFGGERLSGVTILTKGEQGKIVHAAIHHRPLGAALKFSTELARRLHGVLDASYFHRAA